MVRTSYVLLALAGLGGALWLPLAAAQTPAPTGAEAKHEPVAADAKPGMDRDKQDKQDKQPAESAKSANGSADKADKTAAKKSEPVSTSSKSSGEKVA